jgi:phage gpG-like protein
MARNDFKIFERKAKAYIKSIPKTIGKFALLEASNNFRNQGSESEAGALQPWAPRKRADRARRRPRGGGGPGIAGRAILVKSGRLRRSVRIVSTTATSVTIGTDVPYAQGLQEGRGNMPARPFITVGPTTRGKITRKVATDLTNLLG